MRISNQELQEQVHDASRYFVSHYQLRLPDPVISTISTVTEARFWRTKGLGREKGMSRKAVGTHLDLVCLWAFSQSIKLLGEKLELVFEQLELRKRDTHAAAQHVEALL